MSKLQYVGCVVVIAVLLALGVNQLFPGVHCKAWNKMPRKEDGTFFSKRKGKAWKATEEWAFRTTAPPFTESVTKAIQNNFAVSGIHVTDRKAFIYTQARVDEKWLKGLIKAQKLAKVKTQPMTRGKWAFIGAVVVVMGLVLLVPTRKGTEVLGRGTTAALLLACLFGASVTFQAVLGDGSSPVGRSLHFYQKPPLSTGPPRPASLPKKGWISLWKGKPAGMSSKDVFKQLAWQAVLEEVVLGPWSL